jgi:hypothetical protein
LPSAFLAAFLLGFYGLYALSLPLFTKIAGEIFGLNTQIVSPFTRNLKSDWWIFIFSGIFPSSNQI